MSSFSYNAPMHLFLGKDTDARNTQRFAEISGGVNPRELAETVQNLQLYRIGDKTISEVLYLDQRGPYRCLIGP